MAADDPNLAVPAQARVAGLIEDVELVVIDGGPHVIAWTLTGQVNRARREFLG